jgi:hypothetical protein
MSLVFVWWLVACGGAPAEDTRVPEWTRNAAVAEVQEIKPAGDRRLVHVIESQWDFWASIPLEPALQVGDHVWLGSGKMKKFDGQSAIVIDLVAVATPAQLAAFEKLPAPDGGLTVAELFAKKAELAGKPVTAHGRVVKASYDVFDTNWYHLQDGTGSADDQTNDLTVTTKERFEAGQVLRATGPLTIDKDLGFGYFYPAILEDAAVTVEPR